MFGVRPQLVAIWASLIDHHEEPRQTMTCPDATEVVVEVPITMETLILPCSPWTPTGDPMWVLHGRRFTSTMVSLPLTVSMHCAFMGMWSEPKIMWQAKSMPCRAAPGRPAPAPACLHARCLAHACTHARTHSHARCLAHARMLALKCASPQAACIGLAHCGCLLPLSCTRQPNRRHGPDRASARWAS